MSDSDSSGSSLQHFTYRNNGPGRGLNINKFKYMHAYNQHTNFVVLPEGGERHEDPTAAEFATLQNDHKCMVMPVACIRAQEKQGTAFAVTPVYEREGKYEQLWLTADHTTSGGHGVAELTLSHEVAYVKLNRWVEAYVLVSGDEIDCAPYYAPPDVPGFHDHSSINGYVYEDLDVSVLSFTADTSSAYGFHNSFLVPYSASPKDHELCKCVVQGYPGRLNLESVAGALHLDPNMKKAKKRDYIDMAEALYFPNRLNLSAGTVICTNKYLVKHDASTLTGMSGGPGVPFSVPHAFAFIQTEGAETYNVGISKDHPGLVALYRDHILPSLASAVRQDLLPEAQLSTLSSWMQEHGLVLPGADV